MGKRIGRTGNQKKATKENKYAIQSKRLQFKKSESHLFTEAEDEALLTEHANAMLADPGLFPMTEEEKTCGLCRYRSYCGRGVAASVVRLDAIEDEEPALFQGGLDDLEALAL